MKKQQPSLLQMLEQLESDSRRNEKLLQYDKKRFIRDLKNSSMKQEIQQLKEEKKKQTGFIERLKHIFGL